MRASDAALLRNVRLPRWERGGWGFVVVALSVAPLPGVGLVVALALALTVLRRHRAYALVLVGIGLAGLVGWGAAGLFLPVQEGSGAAHGVLR